MSIRGFRVERTAVLAGAAIFVVLGAGGVALLETRDLILPAALLGGIVAGLLGGAPTLATNNAVAAVFVGFVLTMVASAGARVGAIPGMAPGDAVFIGVGVFFIEVVLGGFVVLLLGYVGGYVAERVLRRRGGDERMGPRRLNFDG